MNRTEFAERITSGLAGWLQQLAAQNLHQQVGEDAAKVELVRMISAQRAFIPETSQRPPNWPNATKKRVDISVLGRRTTASGWYGAIELKWPSTAIDVKSIRHRIVEDAVRVAFSRTANMCANFMIIGGTVEALEKLFDKDHTTDFGTLQKARFNSLFSRDLNKPQGSLSNPDLNEAFPDFGDRVPQTTFNGWKRRLATDLIAVSVADVGKTRKGYVYVWQCKNKNIGEGSGDTVLNSDARFPGLLPQARPSAPIPIIPGLRARRIKIACGGVAVAG
jgi:hypothetical protein